jgi:hypothetical protein
VSEALLNFGGLKNEILSLFLFYDRLPEKNSDPLAINLNIEIGIKTA